MTASGQEPAPAPQTRTPYVVTAPAAKSVRCDVFMSESPRPLGRTCPGRQFVTGPMPYPGRGKKHGPSWTTSHWRSEAPNSGETSRWGLDDTVSIAAKRLAESERTRSKHSAKKPSEPECSV